MPECLADMEWQLMNGASAALVIGVAMLLSLTATMIEPSPALADRTGRAMLMMILLGLHHLLARRGA